MQIEIIYFIDGKEVSTVLDGTNLRVLTTSTQHEFKFYIEGYQPIETVPLLVEAKQTSHFNVFLSPQ
jgi:hypothetical protein